MKTFWIFISLLFAFFLDRWIYFFFPTLSFAPSFVLLSTAIWFLRISAGARIFLAFAVGFFLDSISLFPFGTYMMTLCLAALLAALYEFNSAESLKHFETPVWGAGMIIFLSTSLLGVSSLFSKAYAIPFSWRINDAVFIVSGTILWSAVFFFLSTVTIVGFRQRKRPF